MRSPVTKVVKKCMSLTHWLFDILFHVDVFNVVMHRPPSSLELSSVQPVTCQSHLDVTEGSLIHSLLCPDDAEVSQLEATYPENGTLSLCTFAAYGGYSGM